MFFDPREDKFYKTKDLGLDFSDDTYCITTSGNWLLLVDSSLNTYLLNVLTRKRINLPFMVYSIYHGRMRFDQISEYGDLVEPLDSVSHHSAVLSVNERTGDYFVAWTFYLTKYHFFTLKKGDDSWKNWNIHRTKLYILDLAYKNNKLYIYSVSNYISIYDFSGVSPQEEYEESPYYFHQFDYVYQPWEQRWKTQIAIRDSGEVLIIDCLKSCEKKHFFHIFKMNLESKKWERVESIGDNELLIFGHDVTIEAPVQEVGGGIKSATICYVDVWPDGDDTRNSGVFDLATGKITLSNNSKKLDRFKNNSTWFVPGLV